MTADIPADEALARFVVIGGGVGGDALIAMATRSLRVAEATSTVMAGRVERAGTTTLVTRWVVTTRMLGCGAWGAIVSLGLILLQYY
jgi:hypothetical protein